MYDDELEDPPARRPRPQPRRRTLPADSDGARRRVAGQGYRAVDAPRGGRGAGAPVRRTAVVGAGRTASPSPPLDLFDELEAPQPRTAARPRRRPAVTGPGRDRGAPTDARTPSSRRDARRPLPARARSTSAGAARSSSAGRSTEDVGRARPPGRTARYGAIFADGPASRARPSGGRAARTTIGAGGDGPRRRVSGTQRRGGSGRGGSGRRSTTSYRELSGARMTLIMLCTLGGFAALLLKLADLQAVSPQRYAERAKEQRMSVETLPATRGAIVDRNGDPLVTTVARKTIYTDPANVPAGQVDAMVRDLAPLLQLDETTLRERLTAPDSNFQYLARKIDDEAAAKVMALGHRGIYELDEATRMKPAQDLARSLLGTVDTENVGISGLEKSYDAVLTGTPGVITQERSLGGDHTIPDGTQRMEPATPGSTVMLTIDRNLQQVVERAVADQVGAVQAQAGAAVVMDRASGEVLAMASIVNDPELGPVNDELNRAITTTYDPGSVMKLVTMAGVIEHGIVAPWTVRKVPTEVKFFDTTFRDDSRFEDEEMTVTDILARSSNVGTMLLAKDLGEERLSQSIDAFGFGRSTGVGLEHEETGQVTPLPDWSGTSLPTMAIGQGLTATPLQVLSAYNTIANDGEYVSPTLVRSVVSADGTDASRVVADHHRVVSQETAKEVRAMLGAVVQKGTGGLAKVEGYDVAGKTGTAWKARSSGGYGSDGDRDYLSTFVGFAPAMNPRFSIIVVIDEPRSGAYTGGVAAAPVFSGIAHQSLLSFDIPPDAPGWALPADGTDLRARPAVAPPVPDPAVRMAPTAPQPATGTPEEGDGPDLPAQAQPSAQAELPGSVDTGSEAAVTQAGSGGDDSAATGSGPTAPGGTPSGDPPTVDDGAGAGHAPDEPSGAPIAQQAVTDRATSPPGAAAHPGAQ